MRARNLKPAFFKNADLAELPVQHRLLFQGLWCLADCEGRLKDDHRVIKAEVFPYDDFNVNEMLNDLNKSLGRFITRYEVNDQKIIQVLNFLKHQNPHKSEREKGSEFKPQLESTTIDTPEIYGTSPAQNQFQAELVGRNPESLMLNSKSCIPENLVLQTKKTKTIVSDNWRPDPKFFDWMAKKHPEVSMELFEEILEDFKTKSKKNGYKYLCHYSALQDWFKSPYADWKKPQAPVFKKHNFPDSETAFDGEHISKYL